MLGDKVPGLDGFPNFFYQECWDLIKANVVEFVREFLRDLGCIRRWDSTLITIILKKEGAETVSDYRPIS